MVDSPDTELNRAYATRAMFRISKQEIFAAEQVASLAKWLTASLLAVNGAGAIAVLNLPKPIGHPWEAGILFMIGIACALLSGTALQEIYNRMSNPLFEFDNYWTEVGVTGVRKEQTEVELRAAVNAVNRFSFVPPLLGWVSGILFLVGATFLAI